MRENAEGNVPAGDQTYGQDVEIDLYDDSEAEEAWQLEKVKHLFEQFYRDTKTPPNRTA